MATTAKIERPPAPLCRCETLGGKSKMQHPHLPPAICGQSQGGSGWPPKLTQPDRRQPRQISATGKPHCGRNHRETQVQQLRAFSSAPLYRPPQSNKGHSKRAGYDSARSAPSDGEDIFRLLLVAMSPASMAIRKEDKTTTKPPRAIARYSKDRLCARRTRPMPCHPTFQRAQISPVSPSSGALSCRRARQVSNQPCVAGGKTALRDRCFGFPIDPRHLPVDWHKKCRSNTVCRRPTPGIAERFAHVDGAGTTRPCAYSSHKCDGYGIPVA